MIKWTMFTERETETLRFLSTHQLELPGIEVFIHGNVHGKRDLDSELLDGLELFTEMFIERETERLLKLPGLESSGRTGHY